MQSSKSKKQQPGVFVSDCDNSASDDRSIGDYFSEEDDFDMFGGKGGYHDQPVVKEKNLYGFVQVRI